MSDDVSQEECINSFQDVDGNGIIDKEENVPLKIKKLKAALSKAGFVMRPGKGSHTVWKHRALPGVEITLAGHDGDDAKLY
jgi:predicted RNA binding protein YcfA (HicA-like mRNA interferase family)